MAELPNRTAWEIVLRQLPRALRAGLDPDAACGHLPAQLIADAEATSPGLGVALARWVRANVGECAGLARWADDGACPAPDASAHDPAQGGLAELDRAASAGDLPELREIADALVLLGAYDRLAPLADRAAASAWSSLDRMHEVGAALHHLGLASSEAQDLQGRERVPWPELDALGFHGPAVKGEPWHKPIEAAFEELHRQARLLAVGLSAVAGGHPVRHWTSDTLARVALELGRRIAEPLTSAASREAREEVENRVRAEAAREAARAVERESAGDDPPDPGSAPEPAAPPGHVVVCGALPKTGAGKGREVARGYEHAIGHALPLVPTPDLGEVRCALAAEFPYASDAIEAILGCFSGSPYLHAPPLLVVGPPGSGKTRFVRRLGESLALGVFRVDGANDGGGSFGGTERRWYSSEPCKPFMAIARHRQANPILLVDEVDKAATRSDYGRLWDSMLQALDQENAVRFPDPSLHVDLDISWVSVIGTANDTGALPGALLDRMRVVRFPEPRAQHLDVLLPGLLAGIAREAGLDPRFHAPLDGLERAALRSRWSGGSIRRLRRAVEAVLRVRERTLARAVH